MLEDEEQSHRIAERVGRYLAANDRLACQFGMRLESVRPGACRVSMAVTPDMLNAAGATHGGVTFTLADFAFAVASNSHGRLAVGLSAAMQYPAASRSGDVLTAEAEEASLGRTTGVYQVSVRRGDGTLVGLFSGTVFRRDELLDEMIEKDEALR